MKRHADPLELLALRPAQVEALTGLSHGKVNELINTSIERGGLPCRAIGGCKVILVDDLQAWLRSHPVINA